MKPSEYVAAVADELKTNGWIQGHMRNDQGSCVMGAMTSVAFNNLEGGVRHGACRSAHDHMVEKLTRLGYLSIPAWNDFPFRTFGEVQDFLYECQIGLKETE